MAFDFTALLEDPNFLQQMGRTGSMISQGRSAGEALNPAEMIRNTQTQQATRELLDRILGQQDPNRVASPLAPPVTGGAPAVDAPAYQPQMADPLAAMRGIVPTAKGVAGPDSINRQTTADGETITMKVPSAKNLSTFGPNVPAESITDRDRRGTRNPFYQTLLG